MNRNASKAPPNFAQSSKFFLPMAAAIAATTACEVSVHRETPAATVMSMVRLYEKGKPEQLNQVFDVALSRAALRKYVCSERVDKYFKCISSGTKGDCYESDLMDCVCNGPGKEAVSRGDLSFQASPHFLELQSAQFKADRCEVKSDRPVVADEDYDTHVPAKGRYYCGELKPEALHEVELVCGSLKIELVLRKAGSDWLIVALPPGTAERIDRNVQTAAPE